MALPDFAEHAVYVWGAYAVGGVVILGLLGQAIWRARMTQRRLKATQAALAERTAGKAATP
jgi:heme exporter protein CcmD